MMGNRMKVRRHERLDSGLIEPGDGLCVDGGWEETVQSVGDDYLITCFASNGFNFTNKYKIERESVCFYFFDTKKKDSSNQRRVVPELVGGDFILAG